MLGKVAVVGAGISGLASAASLVEKGFEVYLLEASDYFGGRLKQVEVFPGFPPIDLGGDFIHGSTNITQQLAKENCWKVKKAHGGDSESPMASSIFIDGKLYSVKDREHPDVFAAYKVMDDIIVLTEKYLSNIKQDGNHSDVKYCSQARYDRDEDELFGVSMNSWLHRQGLSQKAIDISVSRYCQTHGGTLASLGVLETGLDEVLWESGSGNYRLEGSYAVLISHFVNKCSEVNKRLNWRVKEVKWKEESSDISSQAVCIMSENGQTIQVDYVIIAVPLTILKSKDIIFSPPLPTSKQQAINAIHMGTALKIVCRFKKPFWGDVIDTYCPGSFIHQVWAYSRDPKSDGQECHLAVGFETAVAAAQKIHLSDEVVCEQFVRQLDDMFGTTSEPRPATTNLMSFVYYHWSKHPYVRGGYSSPTVSTHGMRQQLAEPLDGKLFFAGEATAVT